MGGELRDEGAKGGGTVFRMTVPGLVGPLRAEAGELTPRLE
jgi:hypothetical protein